MRNSYAYKCDSKRKNVIYLRKKQLLGILVFAVLFILIVLPIAGIIFKIGNIELNHKIFNTEVFCATKQSVIIMFCTVLITVPISIICAFCVIYTNIKLKTFFSFFCTLPLFLPPISFGFSLMAIFGKTGLLYSVFGVRFHFMGEFGIIFGLILYTFPIAFLMFKNSMFETDGVVYESAVLLKIPMIKYFIYICIPQMKKTIVNVIFLVSIMSLTEYGVCLVVGGKIKTLSLLIYQQIVGSMDFSAGIILTSVLIFPILLMMLFETILPRIKGKIGYRKLIVVDDRRRDLFAYIFLLLISFFIILTFFSFVIMGFSENYPIKLSFTLDNFVNVLSGKYKHYYINSIFISLFVSFFGCVLSAISAYFSINCSFFWVKKLFFLISTFSFMIPGLIFGIGYMMIFKGSIVYNSYIIIIMANIAHFFASPFLLAYQSINTMSPEYADIAKLYKINSKNMFFDVYLPHMRNTLLDMFFYYFSNSMITISAVVFLYTPETMPYSLILKNFEGSMEYLSKSSSVSLVILLTNLCVFIIISLLKSNKKQQ